jgi:hypothetical protein
MRTIVLDVPDKIERLIIILKAGALSVSITPLEP